MRLIVPLLLIFVAALAAVSDPWSTTLQALTKQHLRAANDWNRVWNKHKDHNWDKSLKNTR